MSIADKQTVVNKLLEPGDVERIAGKYDLHPDVKPHFVNALGGAARTLGLKTEERLMAHIQRIYPSFRAESEEKYAEVHKRPKGFWTDMEAPDVWRYLGENTALLDLTRLELADRIYGLHGRLKELDLLDTLYPRKKGGFVCRKKQPDDQVMKYHFGRYGGLRTASETGEILPIEDILRRENEHIFDQGYRFIMNCLDDRGEIKKVRRWVHHQNPRLKITKIARTYDSAEREMKGYVAILVCPKKHGLFSKESLK